MLDFAKKQYSVLDFAKKYGIKHNIQLVEAALKGESLPPLFPEEMPKARGCCFLFNWC